MMELTVEKLTPGGDGFARLDDGRPVFLPGAFPGDRVRIERLEDKKQYARAAEWTLLEAAGPRRSAPCKVSSECGGCDWMSLSDVEQRNQKLALLREALKRTGGFHRLPVEPTMADVGQVLGYRSRVRLHFDERGRMGLFARSSHRLVVVTECLVLAPELERAIAALEVVRAEQPDAFSAFHEVEVCAVGEQQALCFTRRPGSELPSAPLGRLRRRFSVRIIEPRRPSGKNDKPRSTESLSTESLSTKSLSTKSLSTKSFVRGPLRWPVVDGVYLLALPGDFTQVNWAVNQAIVRQLLDGVARRGCRTFLDLYCGVGNFALPLLHAGLTGLAIDDNASAIENARSAAVTQALDDSVFSCSDVSRWLDSRDQSGAFDVAIVDPPRAGIKGDVERIANLAAAIFLCSCDPVTFARDLQKFVALGFHVESLVCYDMFPQTHHFEVTCWLTR